MVFEPLRSPAAFFELGRAILIELGQKVQEEPVTSQQTELTADRSLSGVVETQPEEPWDKLRILIPDIPLALKNQLDLLYWRTLVRGGAIEFIRDMLRCIHIPGDSGEDIANRALPLAGSVYTVQTLGTYWTSADDVDTPSEAISVDPGDPAGGGTPARTNLFKNGDCVDTTAGVWTNDTPLTLSVTQSTYFRANGQEGSLIRFDYLGAGAKSATATFDTNGIAADATPAAGLAVSIVLLALRPSASSSLLTIDLLINGNAVPYNTVIGGLGHDWGRWDFFIDLSAETENSTTGHQLRLNFSDELLGSPVLATEIQIEHRAFSTAFIPYSTIRPELTGSRASGVLKYANPILHRHQQPAWNQNAGRFALTVAFRFTPWWDGADIPAAAVSLYRDGDIANTGNIPGFRIVATATTLVVSALLSDGSTISVGKTVTWTSNQTKRILATFIDWDGSAGSGKLALSYNGSDIATDRQDHSLKLARVGSIFWLGTTQDEATAAGGMFSDVRIDPVYVDGTTITVGDYLGSAAPPDRLRNAWRCVMDPGQKGPPARLKDNTYNLDLQLLETRLPR